MSTAPTKPSNCILSRPLGNEQIYFVKKDGKFVAQRSPTLGSNAEKINIVANDTFKDLENLPDLAALAKISECKLTLTDKNEILLERKSTALSILKEDLSSWINREEKSDLKN